MNPDRPAHLGLSAEELLTTTRAVRKRLDFDRPVPLDVLKTCVEYALQAPTGSNAQGWHFVLLTDKPEIEDMARLYRKGFGMYRHAPFSVHSLARTMDGKAREQQERIGESAEYLVENIHRVPAMLIPCIEGRTDSFSGAGANVIHSGTYGSIFPAVWSFMLAARLHGLGSCITTVHLFEEKTAAEILGIPFERVAQVALLPIAYYTGETFKPAPRKPLDEVLHVDAW